jgi:hypothetical protein
MHLTFLVQNDERLFVQKVPIEKGKYSVPISSDIHMGTNEIKLFLGTETGQIAIVCCQVFEYGVAVKRWDTFETEKKLTSIDSIVCRSYLKEIFPSGKLVDGFWHTVSTPLEPGSDVHLVGTSDGIIRMYSDQTRTYSGDVVAHQVVFHIQFSPFLLLYGSFTFRTL